MPDGRCGCPRFAELGAVEAHIGELLELSVVRDIKWGMRFTLDGEQFELTPELVRSRLEGHTPEDVREYWVEIDGMRWPVKQVISLATGAGRHRFQSQASRRWLRNLGFAIGTGSSHERLSPPRTRPARQPVGAEGQAPVPPSPDIVLVGCVKTKLAQGAAAKDLYVSDYFTKMRGYAEASGRPWFILSAEHGLVGPEDWLEPYERYLPDTSRDYRLAWGEKVAEQLESAGGPLSGLVLDVHAGAAYVESVERALDRRGAQVIDQLKGLSFGRRLSWYLDHAVRSGPTGPDALAELQDRQSARTLDDVMASQGVGLRAPGLYSWWVDEAGAADLARGLAHPVEPGLIYAGLAGATRSGGSISSNTLWGRIATMHLGKKHEFSTLRRSLGSVLAEASRQDVIDEGQLTAWMHAHLRVVLVPVTDVDTLDQLETAVLTELDPPLNLAKVPKTPLRLELSRLRKKYTGA
ncbi:DUF6884 domain-containing protein [Nocardioides sp. CN2-186]|uniref:DUF6884 domain-containing protein n=1 Tax=Nocardioides tweenelious TaxID=3156607 RepID=UPI0032B38C6A